MSMFSAVCSAVGRFFLQSYFNSVSKHPQLAKMSAEALPSFRVWYCTEILALLPFTTPDESLYLIYTINRVLQVISGSLKATMKALSSRSIQEDKHAISEENGVFQHDSSADCQAAIALQLLLKLKRHLKIAFGLSDARCQEFSSNDPLKLGEALSGQNIPFDISGNN
ncbi:hypothetical protein GIB67_012319 [Kingdonia uniflora]|uniref:Uncharacterized protein n=1 Tax=Kingdonia uniflora TaxID=39325 RepID=A0A7J7MVS2_9MAGN|nr:hypothetical protein GIB67_012319 [Kingdonia uniflora]